MWWKSNWLTRCKAGLTKPGLPWSERSPPLGSGDRKLRKRVPAAARWEVAQGRWGSQWRRRWRSLALRERPEPIPSFRGPVECPPPAKQERIGICCSGGGIRSAAFNLGALQALQREEELQKASYLAAVSGGAYIAASFAMVATTRPDGKDAKCSDDSDPELIDCEPPFAPGSAEEQYLRNRSSYMAPDGFGKLTLVYRVLLGFIFNVVFLATPLFAAMLVLGWWIYRSVYPKLVGTPRFQLVKHGNAPPFHEFVPYSSHVPLGCWIAPAAIATLSALIGLLVMLRRLKGDRTRRGLQVLSTRLLILAVLVALFTIGLPLLVALAHNVSYDLSSAPQQVTDPTEIHGAPAGEEGLAGLIATGAGLAGLIAAILAYVRETLLTPQRALKAIEEGNRAIGSRVRTVIAYAGAALAGPLLVIGVMALGLSVGLRYGRVPNWWVAPVPLAIGVGMLAVFGFFYYISDLTSWSLHPFYKRQLCTAFALKRVKAVDAYEISREQEQVLRGSPGGKEFLDTPVAMERRFDRQVSLSKTALDGTKAVAKAAAGGRAGSQRRKWPSLIVCAAANVSDPGATPPGRRVTSFTFSARSVGGPLIGAMRTKQFEEAFDNSASKRRRRDLTLASAVAISGAAVAPSMGKQTRRALTFLTALANIRLGVWVPNPRRVQGQQKACDGGAQGRLNPYGRPRPSYLIRELIGRNRVDGKYLFVSDGGHYENLGLVELLRRGCTEIYCFDASNDNEFSVLGDAVALARSEVGVQIDIDPSALTPGKGKDAASGCAPAACKNTASSNGAEVASKATEQGIAANDVAEGTFRYRDERKTCDSGLASGCSGKRKCCGKCCDKRCGCDGRRKAGDGATGREGKLIYARCVLTEGAPWDVRAHHKQDPSFPHNSTADQLYTDQKFESYRALGEFVAGNAIELMKERRQKLSASAPPPAGAPPARAV